ncbi:MAG: SMC-Scp complex subunit ScpB [Pirellulaceae bacterium]
MRTRSTIPAIQLGSTATRYRVARALSSRSYIHNPSLNRLSSDATLPNVATSYGEFTGGQRNHRLARLEAVLFLSRESLNSRKLSDYADLEDGTEARTLIQQLNQLYQDEQSVLRVERVAGGYQLVTHWQFGRWLKRLGAGQAGIRLSAPAMETLAVVAYRQPVLRVQVEAIRGVSCGEMLRQLMERDLVRIRGRSEELGRPYLYGTTKRFLQQFGLDSIEELLEAGTFNLVEDARVTSGTGGDTADKEEVSDGQSNDTNDKKSEDDGYDEDESDDEYLEEEEREDEDEWEEVDGDDDEEEEDEVDESWQDEEEWEDEEESDT